MTFRILLHSSKTMVYTEPSRTLTTPVLESKAAALAKYTAGLSVAELQSAMHISEPLARTVSALYDKWDTQPTSAAVETFRGDIYSGLRALEWNDTEKNFAQDHLVLLSGLYGILKPFDAIRPYRFEASYRLQPAGAKNVYSYWSATIANKVADELLVNVTSDEYAKLILPYLSNRRVITPVFLTKKTPTAEPTFVVVHSKIARGAYARWLIKTGTPNLPDLKGFTDLGYHYSPEASTADQPVYVCKAFGGIGLSQRLN